MNDSKISVRYSRALFQTAVEKKLLDKVYQDMNFIAELCRIDEVKEILASPIIVPSKKKSILSGLLEKNVEKITLSLVELLIKNGREDYLPAVITAVPVNDITRKQISDLVSSVFKTKVELNESVEKEIIGGFILKVNDSYIDASVKTKLRKVRKGLSVRVRSKQE
jgi:F-type H+-transporting ATPase subunit delta